MQDERIEVLRSVPVCLFLALRETQIWVFLLDKRVCLSRLLVDRGRHARQGPIWGSSSGLPLNRPRVNCQS